MLTIDKEITDVKTLLNSLTVEPEPATYTPDMLAIAFVRCLERRAGRKARGRALDKDRLLIPELV